MKLKIFWIPTVDSASAEDELNRFLAMHRIVQLEKQFCPTGNHGPGWSICVEWLPGPQEQVATVASATGKISKVDYKDVLDDDTFRIFAALRNWRKDAAAAQGVPIYTVATNEQLAEIARQRVTSKGALEKIEGFGIARLAKQADGLVEACRAAIAAAKEVAL